SFPQSPDTHNVTEPGLQSVSTRKGLLRMMTSHTSVRSSANLSKRMPHFALLVSLAMACANRTAPLDAPIAEPVSAPPVDPVLFVSHPMMPAVLTRSNDNARTGANLAETILD